MNKSLNICSKILIVCLLVFVASCGGKSASNKNSVSNINGSKEKQITDKNTVVSKKPTKQEDIKQKNVSPIKETTENDKIKQDKENERKKQVAQKKELAKVNNKKVENIGIFASKQLKLLNANFIKAKDNTFPSLSNSESVFLINTIPSTKTSFEYYKQVFPSFKTVGFSILEYGSFVKPDYIKQLARYKGSNVVIVKRVYNADKDKYIYDIVYLNGNVNNKDFYWFRKSQEAIPINITLSQLAKQEIKPNKYSIEVILNNKEENNKKKDNKQVNKTQQNNDNTELIKSVTSLNGSINNDPSSLIISNFADKESDKQKEKDKNGNTKAVSVSDTDKMLSRVENVVGLWMDSYDKSIIQIQEIDAKVVKDKTKDAYIGPKVKYYGGYIVLNNSSAVSKYNKYRKINNENNFTWYNQDLKFQFNSSGRNSIYLNYNKMPEVAIIRAYPVKGVLMIALADGETRYLIPLGMDVSPKFIKDLYRNLPSHIKGKEASIGKNANYGSGMYGWIISSGAVLLGLGLISMF